MTKQEQTSWVMCESIDISVSRYIPRSRTEQTDYSTLCRSLVDLQAIYAVGDDKKGGKKGKSQYVISAICGADTPG